MKEEKEKKIKEEKEKKMKEEKEKNMKEEKKKKEEEERKIKAGEIIIFNGTLHPMPIPPAEHTLRLLKNYPEIFEKGNTNFANKLRMPK